MSVATADTIATHTGLELDVATKAARRAAQAMRHARRAVGEGVYDAIAADDQHPDYATLVEAESLLCVLYALPMLNLRFTETGGLVKAVGFQKSRTELMSKQELAKYEAAIERQATMLLEELADDPLAGAGIILESI